MILFIFGLLDAIVGPVGNWTLHLEANFKLKPLGVIPKKQIPPGRRPVNEPRLYMPLTGFELRFPI